MIAILFPGSGAFRSGIGRELQENFDVVGPWATAYREATGSTLADDVWYAPRDAPEPSVAARTAAVVAVGCGFHAVFTETFPLPEPPVLIGAGTGILAALVAAGALDPDRAVAVACGQPAQRSWFRTASVRVAVLGETEHLRDPDDMIRAVDAALSAPAEPSAAHDEPQALAAALHGLGVRTVLETGPGTTTVERLRPYLPDGVVAGGLDDFANAQVFLDRIAVRKYFNVQYLAERTLGHVAGTRNRAGGARSEQTVLETARELRRMIAQEDLPSDPAAALSGQYTPTVARILEQWTANDRAKGYTPAETTASLRVLESETLLPLRAIAGSGTAAVAADTNGDEILAH